MRRQYSKKIKMALRNSLASSLTLTFTLRKLNRNYKCGHQTASWPLVVKYDRGVKACLLLY